MAEKKLTRPDITEMREVDLSEVVEIERSCCSMPWSGALFLEEINNPRSVSKTAKIRGRVAGYLCASMVMDEGHILSLAVHPEFRRQGIASSLVADMLAHLMREGCRFIFLEVRASNEIAKKMYEKFNFKFLSMRKDYYVSPIEDAVIMRLKVGEVTDHYRKFNRL